jgi:hypothetical protein
MRLPNKYLEQFYPVKLFAEDTLYRVKVYKFRDMYFCYNKLGFNMTPEGIKIGDIYSCDIHASLLEIRSLRFYNEGYSKMVEIHSRSTLFNDVTSKLSFDYFLRNHTLHTRPIKLPWSLSTNIKKHKLV